MCVIFLAINQHPQYKFIVAANRDEFYERPTASAKFWKENPNVWAGKDLIHGGSWLGFTKSGRFAAVTNFRNPNQLKGDFSRGDLVKNFLFGDEESIEYLEQLQFDKDKYTGFNLLVGDLKDNVKIAYYSNISNEIIELDSGIYGLSNHLLDTNWHKVKYGKLNFQNSLNDVSFEKLFTLLADKTPANDKDLPDTGIGFEREKILSSIFIETPIYGTRCSTVILLENNNTLNFAEKSFLETSQTEIKQSFIIS
jgi:uncharacterized protein with NRDE domain